MLALVEIWDLHIFFCFCFLFDLFSTTATRYLVLNIRSASSLIFKFDLVFMCMCSNPVPNSVFVSY